MIESKEQVKKNECQINQLTDLYVKWCEKNNINNPTSADEVILREELSDTQREWLEKFIQSWDMAMDVDKYIYDQNKKGENMKKYTVVYSKRRETNVLSQTFVVKNILDFMKDLDTFKSKMQLENEHLLEIREGE